MKCGVMFVGVGIEGQVTQLVASDRHPSGLTQTESGLLSERSPWQQATPNGPSFSSENPLPDIKHPQKPAGTPQFCKVSGC